MLREGGFANLRIQNWIPPQSAVCGQLPLSLQSISALIALKPVISQKSASLHCQGGAPRPRGQQDTILRLAGGFGILWAAKSASVAARGRARPGAARYDLPLAGGFGNSVGAKSASVAAPETGALRWQQDTILHWPMVWNSVGRKNLRALLRPGRGAPGAADTILPLAGGFGNSVGLKICERCCARGRALSGGSKIRFYHWPGLEILGGKICERCCARGRARSGGSINMRFSQNAHPPRRILQLFTFLLPDPDNCLFHSCKISP